MDLESLKTFCDGRTEAPFHEPWSFGDFTYATNGFVVARVPRLEDVPENSANRDKGAKFFPADLPEEGFAPIPSIPEAVQCEECHGTSSGEDEDCPECDGEGEVEVSNSYSTYTVECDTCDGSGTLEGGCKVCGGAGKIEISPHVKVGSGWFNPAFLHLFAHFPNCRFRIIAPQGNDLALFRFDGGEVVLMPIRFAAGAEPAA